MQGYRKRKWKSSKVINFEEGQKVEDEGCCVSAFFHTPSQMMKQIKAKRAKSPQIR